MSLSIVIGVICYLLFGHGFSKWLINFHQNKAIVKPRDLKEIHKHKQGIYTILFITWPLIISLLLASIILGSIKGIFK